MILCAALVWSSCMLSTMAAYPRGHMIRKEPIPVDTGDTADTFQEDKGSVGYEGKSEVGLKTTCADECDHDGFCIKNNTVVSSHGIMQGCCDHIYGDWIGNMNPQEAIDKVNGVGHGARIYVQTGNLPRFVEQVLPSIVKPFVLVTGEGDSGPIGGPDGHWPDAFNQLINSRFLLKWYAQNAADDVVLNHTKIFQMPIGVDYHTLACDSHLPWGEKASPKIQELSLLAVRADARPFDSRLNSILVGKMSGNGDFREDGIARLHKNSKNHVDFIEETSDRQSFWKHIADHKYTVSMVGRGVDCHRTWEVLALGGIPFVCKTPLNSIFQLHGLPFVEVADDEWQNLTSAHARAQQMVRTRSNVTPQSLTLGYWLAKIKE